MGKHSRPRKIVGSGRKPEVPLRESTQMWGDDVEETHKFDAKDEEMRLYLVVAQGDGPKDPAGNRDKAMPNGESSSLDNQKRQWRTKGIEVNLPGPHVHRGKTAETNGDHAKWKAMKGKKATGMGAKLVGGQSTFAQQSRFSPLGLHRLDDSCGIANAVNQHL
ncbi:hypothetical protein Dimus_027707, partial [Dionaea muscipula]